MTRKKGRRRSRFKVVLDASVLVSAAFGGTAERALARAMGETLLISKPILAELKRLVQELGRKLNAAQRESFRRRIGVLEQQGVWVEVAGDLQLCRDPEDDAYLETCQAGRAHYLVTRDPDLLEVDREILKRNRLGRLDIVTPATFLASDLTG